MCVVAKGPNHGPAPIPEEGKWVYAKEIKDISGYTHGVGWCAPQQGACKLSLNVKDGIIQEALVETIGCTGMTHSAAMASEILPGKTLLEALNTDLVCDAINTAMRELFLQIVYGRTQSAFSEGAIKIAEMANKVRKNPLRVILNGLGKDAAMIISRINGFTYVQTKFDYYTGKLNVVNRIAYSDGPRAKVNCYGADDVREGVAINWSEDVDVSITGNSTNPTRFQHPVAGTYKKERLAAGKPYFSVASGGGTGRTLHPDNMAAGPASYGMTDTMGRMHSDAQFAGSSSVPAHVEMMGFLGMGNNPMVGATVAIAVALDLAMNKK